ncbi:MAG: rhodanese-like domain-containing protein [Hyphomicrobium sp.]
MSQGEPARRGRWLLYAVGLAAAAAASGMVMMALAPRNTEFTMDAIVSDVYQRFPEVEQLTAEDLAPKLTSAKPPLLIDVRDDAEYKVSHLAGAERVAPASKPADVVTNLSAKVAGREVVYYCSVGLRSSELASATQDGLVKAGATGVSSLVGGVFGWHNAKRALVDASGAPTEAIHPYNAKWGKLVERKELIKLDAK